jgi:DHA2 family multidrug resistance protein
VTTLLARRAQFHQSVLVAHVTPYDAAASEMVARSSSILQSHGSSAMDAGRQAQGILYGLVQRQSSMLAFADAFWLMAVLFLAIVPLMFLMKRAPKSGQHAGAVGAH